MRSLIIATFLLWACPALAFNHMVVFSGAVESDTPSPSCDTSDDSKLLAFNLSPSNTTTISSGSALWQTWVYTPGGTYTLTEIDLRIGDFAPTDTGSVEITVYTADGSHEPDAAVSGSTVEILATAISNNISNNYQFTFSTPLILTSGVEYGVLIEVTGATDVFNFSMNPSTAVANGVLYRGSTGSWSWVGESRGIVGEGIYGCDN